MDKETISFLSNSLVTNSRSELDALARRNMPNMSYVGLILQPRPEDIMSPNYTAVTDLMIATSSIECQLPKSLKSVATLALRKNATDKQVDLATDTFADYLLDQGIEEMRPDHAFVTILQLTRAVDNHKNSLHGVKEPANRANQLAYGTFGKLIDFIPRDDEAMNVYGGVMACLDVLMQDDPDYYGWFMAKARYCITLLNTYRQNETQIFEEDRFARLDVSAEKSREITELFESAHALKNYGIKQVNTDSVRGSTLSLDVPLQSDSGNEAGKGRRLQPVMVATLVEESKYNHIKKATITESFGSAGEYIGTFHQNGAKQVLVLGNDGELYLDAACNTSLRDMYEARNRLGLYELTRAEVIAHYADQVIPAGVKETDPNAPSTKIDRDAPLGEIVNRLILPRINRIKSLTQTEVDQAEAEEESDKSNITIREHDVTYHTRKLLPGQQPSAKAIELATKHGIYLPEGKTFVRAHTRGNGPRVVGHFATGKTVEGLLNS